MHSCGEKTKQNKDRPNLQGLELLLIGRTPRSHVNQHIRDFIKMDVPISIFFEGLVSVWGISYTCLHQCPTPVQYVTFGHFVRDLSQASRPWKWYPCCTLDPHAPSSWVGQGAVSIRVQIRGLAIGIGVLDQFRKVLVASKQEDIYHVDKVARHAL